MIESAWNTRWTRHRARTVTLTLAVGEFRNHNLPTKILEFSKDRFHKEPTSLRPKSAQLLGTCMTFTTNQLTKTIFWVVDCHVRMITTLELRRETVELTAMPRRRLWEINSGELVLIVETCKECSTPA